MKPPSPPKGEEAINWQLIRKRLDRVAKAIDGAQCLTDQQSRELLEKRARQLAQVPPEAPQATEVLQIVAFLLADERYALETRHVWEVVRFTEFTPLPGAPPFVVGIMNLRGAILAIIDLRKFFDLPSQEATPLSRILVLGHEGPEFGVLADATYEVTLLRVKEIYEPPGSVAGIGREYLAGVTQNSLILLDGAALLQDPRLFVDQGDDSRV